MLRQNHSFSGLSASTVIERAAAIRGEGIDAARVAGLLITGVSAVIAIGLIVLMAVLHGVDARWWAFGLADGLVGASLIASTIHELSSERVRHELEVAHATPASGEPALASR